MSTHLQTMVRPPIQRGEYVEILPEFQDPGDDEFARVVVEGEEKGRVTVATLGTGMRIAPTSVLQVEWVRVVPAPSQAEFPVVSRLGEDES